MDNRTQTLQAALIALSERLFEGYAQPGTERFINIWGETCGTHTPSGTAFIQCKENGQVFIELTNIEEWAKSLPRHLEEPVGT